MIIDVPYRMNIHMEFDLVPWLRIVKFTDLSIADFEF